MSASAVDQPTRLEEHERSGDGTDGPGQPPSGPEDGGSGDGSPEERPAATDASAEEEQPVPVVLAAVASFLAAAAAAWMTAGIFEGWLPRALAVLGPALGAGLTGLSYRSKTPSILQYLTLPVLLVVGAIFVVTDTSGGASLPRLVLEAVQEGGLSQPPVAFAPGWRFILLVLTGLLAAGATSLSISLNKPKVGLLLPVPFIFATALTQPSSATLVSSLGALLLAIGSMAVAFGADLAKEGATSGTFEARRLIRGGAVLLVVIGVLAGVSQVGFLFPEQVEDEVVEPRRPELPPPAPDRELFRVESPIQIPYRLGVLDVYGLEEQAWLTAPFRRSELVEIPTATTIPEAGTDESGWSTLRTVPEGRDGRTVDVTFTISDVPGRTIPNAANPIDVDADFVIEYDPRTQFFRTAEARARTGMTYTVTVPAPPNSEQLIEAPEPPEFVQEFLQAPEPPVAVEELLREAPVDNLFDRLQFVRNAYYTNVVAAGAGEPVDVPPLRVAEMLAGGKGTPYEITAGEALLARWAGVPARIGFGYYGGEEVEGADDLFSFRPVHGAMWLETYFEGHGWVPIVGTPPKAQASLSDEEQREDPSISASEEIALIVYVPIKLETFQLLFEIVRYWAFRVLPTLLLLALVLTLYPGVVKLARSAVRRRWGQRNGPAARVAVEYAELRDLANDYNFGDVMHTPLEFVQDLAPDTEHAELAWLVTRGLWGDLARDLRDEDAEAAEQMARSVSKRLRKANTGIPAFIATASRASLKDPYTDEIPNLWPERSLRSRIAAPFRRLGRRIRDRRPPLRFRRASVTTTLLMLGLLLTSCTQTIDLSSTGDPVFPDVPGELDGFEFQREDALESAYDRDNALVEAGRVYSIHDGPNVEGSLQIGAFKAGLTQRERDIRDVREGMLRGIGRFELTRLGTERVYVADSREQRFFAWFSPGGRYYQLFAVRDEFDDADDLFLALLALQQGEVLDRDDIVPPPDPRRTITGERLDS